MTVLLRLAGCDSEARAHVIFIHGLGGHPYGTWKGAARGDQLWPRWLAADLPGVCVWSLAYAAPATNWLGNAMPLQDRAVNVLETLLGEGTLSGAAPLIFVCHSLGGLLIKQILREANDQRAHRAEVEVFLGRVRGIVFLATPHTGSVYASWMDYLRLLVWPSTATHSLVRNDPNLRNLNTWYRGWAAHIAHLNFYETQGTAVGTIVDATSADVGLPGIVPIPIDADHVGICKCNDRTDLVYARTRTFVAELVPNATQSAKPCAVQNFDLPTVSARPALRPAIAVRLGVLLLVMSVVLGSLGSASPLAAARASLTLMAYTLSARDPTLPLGGHEPLKIGELRARLSDQVFTAGVGLQRPHAVGDAWTYADMVIGVERADLDRFGSFDHGAFFIQQMKDGHCWVQGERHPTGARPCNLAATAWVLLAFARLKLHAPDGVFDHILKEQAQDGWWALYEGLTSSESNASVYATAIACLAIEQHLVLGLVPSSARSSLTSALRAGHSWLKRMRSSPCRWKDYPNNGSAKDDVDAISGVVLLALSRDEGLGEVCRACLGQLTTTQHPIDQSVSNTLVEFSTDTGIIVSDPVNHMEFVWTLIGLSQCYPRLDWLERMRAQAYLSKTLSDWRERSEIGFGQSWMNGEAAFMLRLLVGEQPF